MSASPKHEPFNLERAHYAETLQQQQIGAAALARVNHLRRKFEIGEPLQQLRSGISEIGSCPIAFSLSEGDVSAEVRGKGHATAELRLYRWEELKRSNVELPTLLECEFDIGEFVQEFDRGKLPQYEWHSSLN